MMRTTGMLLVAAALLGACSPPPPAAVGLRPVLVRTLDAAGAALVPQRYSGEVRARVESTLAFRVGGKLVERAVDVGTPVRRGQVLARLDPRDVELASASATAQVAAAEADAALARAELERALDLQARNFISASALDARRTASEAARARLRQARAQAAAAAHQVDYAALVADADGVVIALEAEVGQVLAAGQPVLKLAREGEREVRIHVPENRVAGLAVGRAAELRLWSAPERGLAGVVREVAPMADAATRTYELRVSATDAGAVLPLGATAVVSFAEAGDGRVLLPGPAVGREGGQAVVWLVGAEGVLETRAVEIAGYREDGVLVRGELPAGSRVVVAGAHKLVAGEKVRAVEDGAPVALDARR